MGSRGNLYDIAFSHHKWLSCLSHTLQLVICKFGAIHSPKQAISAAHRVVKKVCKSTRATEKLVALSGLKLVVVFLFFIIIDLFVSFTTPTFRGLTISINLNVTLIY